MEAQMGYFETFEDEAELKLLQFSLLFEEEQHCLQIPFFVTFVWQKNAT
jgi:hypothetical protein